MVCLPIVSVSRKATSFQMSRTDPQTQKEPASTHRNASPQMVNLLLSLVLSYIDNFLSFVPIERHPILHNNVTKPSPPTRPLPHAKNPKEIWNSCLYTSWISPPVFLLCHSIWYRYTIILLVHAPGSPLDLYKCPRPRRAETKWKFYCML